MESTVDPRLGKWIRWLDDIKIDVQKLLIYKHIFHELQGIISNNKDIQKPSVFYQYVADTYVAYVTIGIRRQVKCDSTSISLVRLLSEIKDTPYLLSRTYYKNLYLSNPYKDLADKHFDRIVGSGNQHIQIKTVEHDLSGLNKTATIIEEYADKKIAHHDKRAPKKIPRFTDVNTCLNTLDKTCCRYHKIFHATGYQTFMPTFQYDWKEIFREPWIKKRIIS